VGIAAVLKRVDGQQVRNLPDPTGGVFDAAGDLDRVLPPGSEPFPLLNQFDPYGSVVFAGQQMNELLAELRAPEVFVHPFRSNPYIRSGVFVHLVWGACSAGVR
jgi:hypothetical protein